MERRQPASTGTSLPPVVSSVRLLLRPRPTRSPSLITAPTGEGAPVVLGAVDGEGAPPQPPPPPLIPPLVSGIHGAVDAVGSAIAPAGSPPPVFLATRGSESEIQIHPDARSRTTTAGTTGQAMLDLAPGAVDSEGVPPQPPLPAGAALTPPLASGRLEGMEGDGAPGGSSEGCRTTTAGSVSEGLPPAPAPTAKRSRIASPTLSPRGNSDDDTESGPVSCGGDPWADGLPVDVILRIASLLRSSRKDLESMRFVCKAWRQEIPSTMGPSLVLSKKKPNSDSRLIILEIPNEVGVHGPSLQHQLPLIPPPVGASCWGSALGLIALTTSNHDSFVYCMHCASLKQLLSLPAGALPKGIFLEPHSPVRFLLMKMSGSDETVMRVDRTDFPWNLDNELSWLPYPGFDDAPLISVALSAGILRAAASTDSVILIDESGRSLDAIDEMVSVQAPLIYEDGQLDTLWNQNGRHLFLCSGKLYYVELLDSAGAPAGVAARLFIVEKMTDGGYSLIQVRSIGHFALYLGSNQAFVMPSADQLLGRLPNTLYVEDFRSKGRGARILALNIDTLVAFTIPFPEDVSASISDMLPAVWVGLPTSKDLYNHCKLNEHWDWWD